MIFNNSVTVYHDLGDCYKKSFYVRASVFADEKLEAKIGGRNLKKEISLRIFTDRKEEIATGDRLVIGHSEEQEPPTDSHVIMSVMPRLIGTRGMQHYRIFAV